MYSRWEWVHVPITGIPPEIGEKPNFGHQMEKKFKNVTNVPGVFGVGLSERRPNHFAAART